jgi:hypothetical protein
MVEQLSETPRNGRGLHDISTSLCKRRNPCEGWGMSKGVILQ